jgi:hypothetical protein
MLQLPDDLGGIPTNGSGLDLTPDVMDKLGVEGPQGKRSVWVNWEFAQ